MFLRSNVVYMSVNTKHMYSIQLPYTCISWMSSKAIQNIAGKANCRSQWAIQAKFYALARGKSFNGYAWHIEYKLAKNMLALPCSAWPYILCIHVRKSVALTLWVFAGSTSFLMHIIPYSRKFLRVQTFAKMPPETPEEIFAVLTLVTKPCIVRYQLGC